MATVHIIESDSYMGQKVDEVKSFDTDGEAQVFCLAYNERYNPPKRVTPRWYMFAMVVPG